MQKDRDGKYWKRDQDITANGNQDISREDVDAETWAFWFNSNC